MDKRVLVVGAALLLVAGAFLAFPPGVDAPPPPPAVPAAGGDAAAAAEAPAGEVTAPEPEHELSAVDLGCGPLGKRMTDLVSPEFARDAGLAAHEKFPGDDALIAQCARYMAADDAALIKLVETELGIKAP